MKTSYSTTYRDLCLALQRTVEHRIGRALSPEEAAGIWNAGSLMILEAVERAIMHTDDPAALPELLRADTIGCHDRFIAAQAKTARLLAQHPVRAFFARHRHQLRRATTIYDLLLLAEQYPPPRKRRS